MLIGAHVIEITKTCNVTKTLKTFFKALANRFRLTSKLISRVKER